MKISRCHCFFFSFMVLIYTNINIRNKSFKNANLHSYIFYLLFSSNTSCKIGDVSTKKRYAHACFRFINVDKYDFFFFQMLYVNWAMSLFSFNFSLNFIPFSLIYCFSIHPSKFFLQVYDIYKTWGIL